MFKKRKFTEDQFTNNWEKSKEKFYRFAYCYVRNENDALEILSEATYLAYASFQKLEKIEYFDTWMCRIIMNEAYKYLKKTKRFIPSTDSLPDYIEAAHHPIEDDYSNVERRIDLFNLLEKVSEEEKTILILKYFEEKSIKEISIVMELPESTIKSKLYRTLNKLQSQVLKEEEK